MCSQISSLVTIRFGRYAPIPNRVVPEAPWPVAIETVGLLCVMRCHSLS